jgi:hypothetical protein
MGKEKRPTPPKQTTRNHPQKESIAITLITNDELNY